MQDRIVFRQTDGVRDNNLQAENVRLVHLQVDDAELLVHFVNDREITRFIGRTKPTTLSEEKEWIENVLENMDTKPLFGIEVGGELIGTMGINVNTRNRTAETGALIGRKEYWGEGYGTDAKMLILEYAFQDLGLRKLYSRVYASNPRSKAYSKKCGYECIGTLPDKHLVHGAYVDEVIMEVTPETWRPQYEAWKRGDKLPVDS